MRCGRAPAWAGMAVAASLLLSGCGGDPSALDPRGPAAERIAALWWLMFTLGTIVYVVVVAFIVRAIVASRRARPTDDADAVRPGDTGDSDLEPAGLARRLIVGGGVVLPLAILVPLAVETMRTGNAVAFRGHPDHLAVEVIGHQFWWEVRYPQYGAVTANEIHIPVGRTVDVTLRSHDVIHSFWVPRLAGKIDNIPGMTTNVNIEAREPGVYRGFCAEFCGIQHANMQLIVVAEPETQFEGWVAGQARDRTPPAGPVAQEGERVFDAVGCGACHAVRGTPAIGTAGPDLTHFGSRQTIGAGTVANNRGNLGGWIADPHSIKLGVKMPATPLDGEQLRAVIAYLEGLS